MYCTPACIACRRAGICPKGEVPALPHAEPERTERCRGWAPNQLPMTDMPCGCVTIPWPVLTVLGSSVESFLCDRHGEVRLTQAWRKRKDKEAPQAEELAQEIIPF